MTSTTATDFDDSTGEVAGDMMDEVLKENAILSTIVVQEREDREHYQKKMVLALDTQHEKEAENATLKAHIQKEARRKTNIIAKFEADISKFTADAEQLGHEISVHDEDIATWEGDQKAATKVSDTEKTDHTAEPPDILQSIEALAVEEARKEIVREK